MNKNFIITIIILAVLIIGVALYSLLSQSGNGGNNVPQETPVSLDGTYVCLPHAGIDSSNVECAYGLKTSNGNYYGFNLQNNLSAIAGISENDEIKVVGNLISRSQLSSDNRMLAYDIEGVIKVDSIEKTGENTSNKQVVPGGVLSFSRPDDFGLAVNKDQVLKSGVIPPCDEGFDYCLYYNDNRFDNTNFEDAGIRIKKRADLDTKSSCLETQPDGYTNITPKVEEKNDYSISSFSVQGAGAGHYATGTLYRLSFDSSCYEFEARIAETQFANYPEGSINKFTDSNREYVQTRLNAALNTVRITSNESEVIFGN